MMAKIKTLTIFAIFVFDATGTMAKFQTSTYLPWRKFKTFLKEVNGDDSPKIWEL
jgi:hypothetical protein